MAGTHPSAGLALRRRIERSIDQSQERLSVPQSFRGHVVRQLQRGDAKIGSTRIFFELKLLEGGTKKARRLTGQGRATVADRVWERNVRQWKVDRWTLLAPWVGMGVLPQEVTQPRSKRRELLLLWRNGTDVAQGRGEAAEGIGDP